HEVSLPRANGDRFAAIAHVSNLLEFDPPLYLLSVEDITERKEAEAAHVQLETEKRRVHLLEEFISDASHDLKNPLTTIGTSLYLLRRRHNIPEDSRHMRVVEQEVAHLTNLFDDLLALPRMDSENYMLNTEPTPLADLVRAEVESHRPMANQRAHALAFHPAVTTMPPAMVDRKELARAVRQLITNAIKYTPHGGHIHVRLYSEASFHVIAVEDNGEGIAPEVAALIFERFYRVSGDAIKVTDGLGIGLSIVKRVVEAHNGHVEVESEPGLGSTFRLLLPMEITHHSMPSS
ncbi:MAG: HAMP domain-containing sensor histidine kinase, partial [Chloroflexota bacterium]